jgi:hypothetical protein
LKRHGRRGRGRGSVEAVPYKLWGMSRSEHCEQLQ